MSGLRLHRTNPSMHRFIAVSYNSVLRLSIGRIGRLYKSIYYVLLSEKYLFSLKMAPPKIWRPRRLPMSPMPGAGPDAYDTAAGISACSSRPCMQGAIGRPRGSTYDASIYGGADLMQPKRSQI